MKIHVRYMAQLKRATGTAQETIELASASGIEDLLRHLADANEALLPFFWHEEKGRRPSLLVSIGERMLAMTENVTLADGDIVTLMTPMAGG